MSTREHPRPHPSPRGVLRTGGKADFSLYGFPGSQPARFVSTLREGSPA